MRTTPFARRRSRRAALRLPLASAILLALTAPALAQEGQTQAEDRLDEVVVTARRVSEKLSQTPVAVSAFSADALQALDARTIGDLQSAVPNLTLHEGDAANAVVYIRGVGQVDSLAFADPGVGIYLDDVYLGRAQGAFLDVVDVDRIEVLRGPQGTLYGRNTIGGAVKYVSKLPAFTPEASLSLGAGNYSALDATASLNLPLVADRLAARASLAYLSRDGFSTNTVNGRDDGDKKTVAGRLALLATPTERFSLLLTADSSNDRPRTSRTPARADAVFGTPANADPFAIQADFNDLSKLTVRGLAATATWQATDAVTLKSITAYRRMGYDAHLDLDATRYAYFGVYDAEEQNQFSQELQASYAGDRLSGTAGVYFFREHDDTISGLYGPAIGLVTGSDNDQYNRSFAGYGQGSYRVTDALSLTAGLRYTYETKHFARTQEYFGAGQTLPVPLGQGLLATDIDTRGDWASLSPKAGIDYRLSDTMFAYASASRGFKSGGFDGRSSDAAGARPYAPETLWAYEVGLKTTLDDGRVNLNLAAFWNDYTNLQLSSFVADAKGNFSALFTNAGAATIRGLEMEVRALLARGLTVSATLGYLDAGYDRYIGPGGVDISQQRHLVNAPKWDGRLGADYTVPLGGFGTLRLDGGASFRSKTYPTVSSSELLAQPFYVTADAQATLTTADEHWSLAASVKNLTDRRYIDHGFDLSDSLGYQLAYYGDPRTWRLTLRYSY
ncbi:TonB-dependent receptor [Azospirillum sp. B4]|uniref:TonB-dependent receptor n=1 Tax=Azospirillum sp. B4 TaxID=95605 RepID=UPI000349DFD6|nr:TonB-dependent receptor [Azospirillum sp. B4]